MQNPTFCQVPEHGVAEGRSKSVLSLSLWICLSFTAEIGEDVVPNFPRRLRELRRVTKVSLLDVLLNPVPLHSLQLPLLLKPLDLGLLGQQHRGVRAPARGPLAQAGGGQDQEMVVSGQDQGLSF